MLLGSPIVLWGVLWRHPPPLLLPASHGSLWLQLCVCTQLSLQPRLPSLPAASCCSLVPCWSRGWDLRPPRPAVLHLLHRRSLALWVLAKLARR